MKLNRYIDHTLLRPDSVPEDIEKLCREAVNFDFRCAVVSPTNVSMATKLLKGTRVAVCSVVAFPMGASHTEVKIAEAIRVEADGADEIDVVANIGWLQSGQFSQAARELYEIRRRLSPDTIMKVIIETPLLKPEYWPEAVEAVIRSGAHYVKTATGLYGATSRRHVEQLKSYAGDKIKIKAAGGIKKADDAMSMIMAGASRIGSSSSVAIMEDLKKGNKK